MQDISHRRPMCVSLCAVWVQSGCRWGAEMHVVGSGNWEGLREQVALSSAYMHASHATLTVFCSVKPLCLLTVGGTWECAQLGTWVWVWVESVHVWMGCFSLRLV